MRNLPVHWYEGLFLRPQHFQAADRYWTELIATADQWGQPYNYGVHAFEYSREALANNQFQIHTLQARMRDGTLIMLGGGSEPDRLDLKPTFKELGAGKIDLADAFGRESTVIVYLAIPKLQLGRANVGRPGEFDRTRYIEADTPAFDETQGGGDQSIQVRTLNARLLLSTQDLSGYEILPIARIRRASEEQAVPRLDPDYIPPVLSIGAWPALGRDTVRAINDVIGQKIEVLTSQIINRGIGLDSRDPGDSDRILMLSQLNTAHSALSILTAAQGVHPFNAYIELSRIVGQLSIFARERRTEEMPPYDHDELARIFAWARTRIEQLINMVRDYEFEQRYLIGVGLGMQVTLEPKWFNSDWQWYIGVNKGDLTEAECRELLSPGMLDWKFGSGRQVEILFKNRAAGLNLTVMERQIRALPARKDWIYFEVDRRDSPAWRDVQETQSMAMRLKDSLILNRDRLQGERQLIVSARGKAATLQFALFAVPSA
ncbi:MAG: type VI secretion system baseplate subunit TssK [Planctomycetota bacterium]|nr:type VI secretion system baseplate subunit TssK [Planctomycetota bacterium]